MVKRLLTPRWIAFTVFVVVAAVGMCALGWWQWTRYAEAGGSWQNLAYTVQWPLFAAFAVYVWWRLLRDAGREVPPPPPDPVASLPPLPPKVVPRQLLLAAPEEPDEELATYNQYLSRLNEQDR